MAKNRVSPGTRVTAICCHFMATLKVHSGKSVTIPGSNHALGVYKVLYVWLYVPKSSILFAGIGVWIIISVACEFSSIKIDYSDYLKS